MVVITWWSHGHGGSHVAVVTWWWSHGGGHMVVTWGGHMGWSHGGGHMVTWGWPHFGELEVDPLVVFAKVQRRMQRRALAHVLDVRVCRNGT
eukprot:3226095-Prymnesium_polylepis.1